MASKERAGRVPAAAGKVPNVVVERCAQSAGRVPATRPAGLGATDKGWWLPKPTYGSHQTQRYGAAGVVIGADCPGAETG